MIEQFDTYSFSYHSENEDSWLSKFFGIESFSSFLISCFRPSAQLPNYKEMHQDEAGL